MKTQGTGTKQQSKVDCLPSVFIGQPGGFSLSLTKQDAATDAHLSVLHLNEPALAAVGAASEVREQVAEGDAIVKASGNEARASF